MTVLFILIILLALSVLLLFAFDTRVKLVFDTERNDMHMSVYWLYPFIKVIGTLENARPVLDFYVFNKQIIRKKIDPKKGNSKIKKTDLLKIFNPKDIRMYTNYGFRNPSTTGITCGAFNAASQFINIDSLNHMPDFMSTSDYIYLDAEASVNLGASLTNLIKYSKNRRNLQWIRTQP